MTTADEDLQEAELHDAVSGLGNWHKEDRQSLYLADKDVCLACLRDLEVALSVPDQRQRLQKHLKLGEWRVLSNHLVPLFNAYREDPEITALTLKVLVQLTTHDDFPAEEVLRHLEYLQDYKEAFANKDAFIIIMNMLVNGMDEEEEEAGKGENDDAADKRGTFETTLKLLRNLVTVPDPCPGDAGFTPSRKALQQTFIKHFHDEGALDFFILFAEQIESEQRKDQAWSLLDVAYSICAQVDPAKLANSSLRLKTRTKLSTLLEGADAANRILQRSSTRHSRFGTRMQLQDAIGGTIIANSVSQANAVSKGKRVSQREYHDRGRKENMFHDPFFVDLEEGAVRDHNQLNPHVRNGLEIARDYSEEVTDGLRKFFEELIESSCSSLISLLRSSLTTAFRQGNKGADAGGEHGAQRLLNFVAWILEFHRHMHFTKVSKATKAGAPTPAIEVTSVQGALDLDITQFVTARLREYGKKENIHASYLVIVMRVLSQQVKTISVLLNDKTSEMRDIGEALTQTIVKDDVMANLAWIMKNFKTTVHDPRVLSYAVELYHNMVKLMSKIAEATGKQMEFQVEKTHGAKILRGATTADKEIARLNDARVVENMFYLLEKYKRHTPAMHSMLTKLLHSIIKQQPTNIVVFFELGYFVRIYRIISDPVVKDVKHGKRYEEMTYLLRFILRQFFKCAEKNHCVFVELLFRKVHENAKDALLENSNAEFEAILEDYETEEYRQVLERMREGETMKAMKIRQRAINEGGLPWTEEEDRVLRDNFAAYAEHPLCSALLAAALPPDNRRDSKQVLRRLKELKLIETKAEKQERARAEDPAATADGGVGSPSRKRRKTDPSSQLGEDPSSMDIGGSLEADMEALLDEALMEETQAADKEEVDGARTASGAAEPPAEAGGAPGDMDVEMPQLQKQQDGVAAGEGIAATHVDTGAGEDADLELELEQLMEEATLADEGGAEEGGEQQLPPQGGPAAETTAATAADEDSD